MACCGGSRPQNIRKQTIERPAESPVKQTVQKRLERSDKPTAGSSKPISVTRQYVLPRQQCTICGYPGMAVYIANRERMQCSNVNCKELLS